MRFAGVVPLLMSFIVLLSCVSTVTVASPRQYAADMVRERTLGISKFDDVVSTVLSSDLRVQARFAEIAIEIMIVAYMAETERPQRATGVLAHDDPSWRLDTLRYIERLRTIAASVRPGAAVRIIKEPHTGIRLVIERQQVMLSAPRLEEQLAFERRIDVSACRLSKTQHDDRRPCSGSRIATGWRLGVWTQNAADLRKLGRIAMCI